MHIKNKLSNRIVAMLMCILLLSNFFVSVVLATDSTTSGAGVTADDAGRQSIHYAGNTTTVVYSGLPQVSMHVQRPIINTITVAETGVYKISIATSQGEASYCMYDKAGRHVRLAAEYKNGNYNILTGGPSSTSSTIDVLLEAGKEYKITVDTNVNWEPITIKGEKFKYPLTFSVTKRDDLPEYGIFATNISSQVVSSKDSVNPNAADLERYDSPNIKIYEFSQEEIDEYILYGNEDDMSNGGELEGILVDLILAIGTMFTFIVEKLIGANTNLTIDNIIFNKLDQTVIDLTPLGGIKVPSIGKGIFHQAKVGETINVLFNALKNLAIAVYLVMFLYIGVKILMSIGSADQKKYTKYIEYWLSGLILLMIIPYFLPAIPAMTNTVVEMMADEAKQINGKYSTKEILARLGYNTSYLGEDAEVVELEKLIDEKIQDLNSQMGGSNATLEEAQQQIDEKIDEALSQFTDLSDAEKIELRNKIDSVKALIDDNFDTWNDEKQAIYEEYIEDVRATILSSATVSNLVSGIVENLSANVKNDTDVNSQIERVMWFVQRRASNWNKTTITVYNSYLNTLQILMQEKGLEDYYSSTVDVINDVKTEYVSYASSLAFRNLEKLFSDYKDAVIQEEIDELQEMKNMLARDIMTRLKQNAQSQNRIVYAIAWAILLFQMFAILFLYYKRLFAMVIIIIIFPLVMAFYVIDKIGDGQSQSLKSWFDEFLANCLVQVLHAAIYIILVNIGIEACEADPNKNWFILVLAVCFLFPGEKIVRGILGLKASTLDELKTNVGGVIAGTAVVAGVAVNTTRATKSFVKAGGVKGVKQKWEKELKESEQKAEEKKKKKQKLHDSRAKSRSYREERLSEGDGSLFDKALNKADKAKDRIKASGVVTGTKEAVSKLKESKVGKIAKGTYTIAKATTKYGKFALKKTAKLARRGTGLTMGALTTMENFSESGVMKSVAVGGGVALSTGGFQTRQKEIKSNESSRFTTKYENGKKVSGKGKTTPGNVNTTDKSSSNSLSSSKANKIRTKINTNVTNPTIPKNN